MRKYKRKCIWCTQWFLPHHRLDSRQVCCGQKECIAKQSNKAKQRWRWQHRILQRQMVRDWFNDHPNYLAEYRQQHPLYTEKNRQATRLRMQHTRFDKRNRYSINT